MKILVIPDVHLKPWMFERAAKILKEGAAEKAVCLMDIPDDWGKAFLIGLYEETYDAAIRFQREFPETLWCYGNHDLSYAWLQPESGFSSIAMPVAGEKFSALKREMPDESSMKYIHRIDNVLFLHGGLTHAFVKYYVPDADYDDADAVLAEINALGAEEMWDDASPIWFRPQFSEERMYKENELLQVVGHTPVMQIDRNGSVLSCDLFSTYRNGKAIGTQEFLLIDTETLEYRGIR